MSLNPVHLYWTTVEQHLGRCASLRFITSNNLRDGNPFSRFVVFVEFPSVYASLEHFFSKKEVSVDFPRTIIF
jgi:hypothetical protein